MKVDLLSRLFFAANTVILTLVFAAGQPPKSIASVEENNTRLVFYGVGIGMGALMCDFLESEVLNETIANIAISNMRSEFKTDSTYTDPALGPVRTAAVVDGFNEVAKEFDNCQLRL